MAERGGLSPDGSSAYIASSDACLLPSVKWFCLFDLRRNNALCMCELRETGKIEIGAKLVASGSTEKWWEWLESLPSKATPDAATSLFKKNPY
jgi:hypothetical protein